MQYPLDEMVRYCYCNEMNMTGDDPKGFIARVEEAREQKGLGRYEFSSAIGQGDSYWSVWITRHRERGGFPQGGIMSAMAETLGVSMDYLLGKQATDKLPEIQTTPLAELLRRAKAWPYRGRPIEGLKASAGKGSRIPQGFDESRPKTGRKKGEPDPIQNIEVEGECMVDLLYPGDIVVVDTRQTPDIGDVVVGMRFHDEVLVKFLREHEGRQYLESKDGQIIPLDQYIRLLGPAVLFQRRLR